MSDTPISQDLKARIRASQAKGAIRQMAGFRARAEDLFAACDLLAERFPDVDLRALAAEIADDQAHAAATVARNLTLAGIAARAERAYDELTAGGR